MLFKNLKKSWVCESFWTLASINKCSPVLPTWVHLLWFISVRLISGFLIWRLFCKFIWLLTHFVAKCFSPFLKLLRIYVLLQNNISSLNCYHSCSWKVSWENQFSLLLLPSPPLGNQRGWQGNFLLFLFWENNQIQELQTSKHPLIPGSIRTFGLGPWVYLRLTCLRVTPFGVTF